MQFTDSIHAQEAFETLELPYGNFYFIDRLVIAEVNEGVTFTLEKARPVITFAEHLYGKNVEIGYILSLIHI